MKKRTGCDGDVRTYVVVRRAAGTRLFGEYPNRFIIHTSRKMIESAIGAKSSTNRGFTLADEKKKEIRFVKPLAGIRRERRIAVRDVAFMPSTSRRVGT